MTLPLPTLPVPVQPVRCLNPLCRRWLRDPESLALGYGPDCAEARGLRPPRRRRVASGAADQALFDVDPVATSVAAYTDRVDAYATRNEAKMADEVARFCQLLPPGSAVLDAGCGPGRDVARFAAAGHRPIGVDLSAAFVARACQVAPVLHADLRALPLPAQTFDGVWACASLVHLPPADAVRALAELHRVTRTGGRLLASVKTTGTTGWQDTAIGVRWFQVWPADDFAAAVTSAGWSVAEVGVGGDFVDVWARKESR